MHEHINYMAVGAFILLGTTALLGVGFWLGGAGQAVPMSTYTILFERDVNGLTEGSPVRYLGVDVGEVNTIGLSGSDGLAVEVQIEVAQSTPVDGGTYASLAYQGITGVAFVDLAAEPGEHGPIELTAGRTYPILPARDVGIAALLSSGPEVVGRLNTLLENADAMLDEKNRRSVTRVLENLEQATGELATMPARLSDALATLQATLEQARDVTTNARPELLASTQNLQQTTANLVNSTERLERWLSSNDAAIDSFLSGGIGETAALVADTRGAMRELQKLSAELRSNPSRLIYKPALDPVVVAR